MCHTPFYPALTHMLSVYWHFSCSCTLLSQSLQTHPFNPLQPLSKYFPLGTPECLLLPPPFVYCLLLQLLSIEIRREPSTLSQAAFSYCKLWKWQLSSWGWSAYLSLGKPLRGQSALLRQAWHSPQSKYWAATALLERAGGTMWTLKLMIWAQPFKTTVTLSSWDAW